MSVRVHADVIGRHAYFLVEDLTAGRKHVYTVYAVKLYGDKNAEIIGRELPLGDARAVIQRHAGLL